MKCENPYKPHTVEIKDIRQETADTKTYRLSFCDAAVQGSYTFEPGQFNMVTVFGIGEAPVSLSSNSVDKESFEHTIRNVGNVTNALAKLSVGDTFHVRGPYGTGWPMDFMKGKNVLIIAGGIGLAPLRPVIYSIADRRQDFETLEILYGARAPEDGLFRSEYDRWRTLPRTVLRLTVDEVPQGVDWNYNVGVVTELFSDMVSRPENTVVITCGPEIMMKYAVRDLLELGFSPDQIFLSLERRMNCGISKCGFCQIGPKFVCQDGPVFSYQQLLCLTEKVF